MSKLPKISLSPLGALGIFAVFALLPWITPGPKRSTENGEWLALIALGVFLPLFLARTKGQVSYRSAVCLQTIGSFYLVRALLLLVGVSELSAIAAAVVLTAMSFAFGEKIPTWRLPPLGRPKALPIAAWSAGLTLSLAALAWCFRGKVEPPWGALHHIPFYVGPIELIKRGHLLLYDVPSQYGVLSVLTPALLPTDALTGFLTVNAALSAATALLVFALLIGGGPFRNRPWIAAAFAFACLFFMPGKEGILDDSLSYPSTGAYRFFWSFLLASLFALPPNVSTKTQKVLQGIVFTVSAFWSLESFAYSLAILGFVSVGELIQRKPLKEILRIWVMPVAGTVCVAFLVFLLFQLRWGLSPDWKSYVEFALHYSAGGRGAESIAGYSFVWMLFLSYFFVVTAGFSLGAPAWAVAGFFLGTMTYFISRSVESNLWALCGFWFPLAFFIAFRGEQNALPYQRTFQRVMLTLAFVFVLATGIRLVRNGHELVDRIASVGDNLGSHLVASFTEAEKELSEALSPNELGINALGFELLPEVSMGPFRFFPWLPIYPLNEFLELPGDRQKEYIRRSVQRLPQDGYLLLNPSDPWARSIYETLESLGFEMQLIRKVRPNLHFVKASLRPLK